MERSSTGRLIWHYFWGTVRRPANTFSALSNESSLIIGAAPILIYFGLGLAHGLLRRALYGPQIGSEPMLTDPTLVLGYGYWSLTQDAYRNWGTLFIFLILPMMWVLLAGITQVFGILWRGPGTFEVNLMTHGYAVFVPWVMIQSVSEILFGIPLNLIFDTEYFWVEAMMGEFGSNVALIWNAFVIGVYSIGTYAWSVVLLIMAIRRTQGSSRLHAAVTAIIAFGSAVFLFSTFVR